MVWTLLTVAELSEPLAPVRFLMPEMLALNDLSAAACWPVRLPELSSAAAMAALSAASCRRARAFSTLAKSTPPPMAAVIGTIARATVMVTLPRT